jgi:uncharacterized protein (TIGR03067 family)
VTDEMETDLKNLTGTWEEVSHSADGKAEAADELKSHKVVIDAAGKWEAVKDGTSLLEGTVKLDTANKPKAADWAIEGSDMATKGICEVDRDMWKHCFSLTERPTKFGSKEGSGVYYIVLKRVKE